MFSEVDKTNKTSPNNNCQDIREIYQNLDQDAKIILAVLFATSGFIGVLCNSLVVFCIHKTKQLDVQSIRLFHNFSIIDTLNSIVNFVHLKIILNPYQTDCRFYYGQRAFIQWTIFSSSFMVPITAIDRYIHVKYKNNYSSIFTPFRFKIIHVIYFICAVYQTSISIVIIVLKGLYADLIYILPLNVIGFVVVVSFNIMSIYILKKYMNETEISSTKRNITKIASIYFYFYLFNLVILLVQPFLTRFIGNSEGVDSSALSVNRMMLFLIPTFIAIGNALSFLWINRKCRNLLKSFLCCETGSISSAED